ncbi:hypothetical protein B0H13DRAFT_2323175 [Mycena leptocephala]|nr:hypothetical protein B0H13DRAFT_2323175 [Mycena leptocephala]
MAPAFPPSPPSPPNPVRAVKREDDDWVPIRRGSRGSSFALAKHPTPLLRALDPRVVDGLAPVQENTKERDTAEGRRSPPPSSHSHPLTEKDDKDSASLAAALAEIELLAAVSDSSSSSSDNGLEANNIDSWMPGKAADASPPLPPTNTRNKQRSPPPPSQIVCWCVTCVHPPSYISSFHAPPPCSMHVGADPTFLSRPSPPPSAVHNPTPAHSLLPSSLPLRTSSIPPSLRPCGPLFSRSRLPARLSPPFTPPHFSVHFISFTLQLHPHSPFFSPPSLVPPSALLL